MTRNKENSGAEQGKTPDGRADASAKQLLSVHITSKPSHDRCTSLEEIRWKSGRELADRWETRLQFGAAV